MVCDAGCWEFSEARSTKCNKLMTRSALNSIVLGVPNRFFLMSRNRCRRDLGSLQGCWATVGQSPRNYRGPIFCPSVGLSSEQEVQMWPECTHREKTRQVGETLGTCSNCPAMDGVAVPQLGLARQNAFGHSGLQQQDKVPNRKRRMIGVLGPSEVCSNVTCPPGFVDKQSDADLLGNTASLCCDLARDLNTGRMV